MQSASPGYQAIQQKIFSRRDQCAGLTFAPNFN
jgi:hypothetical protein